MGGKSVVLKTIVLNQLLAQFGFGTAAACCCVNLVDGIVFCIGDDQNTQKGLSSFAAEMLAIDGAVKRMRNGDNVLVLVEEPARTTNPVEGTALVEGLLEVISTARQGVTVEREARDITVFTLDCEVTDTPTDYILTVTCSGGTYIRTLCADIGAKLGCGGVMKTLER